MTNNFSDFGKNMRVAVDKYKELEFEKFIENVLIDLGLNTDRMDNVYINEVVRYPDVYGFLKKDGKYISYATNDRYEFMTHTYDSPYAFMTNFLLNTKSYQKIKEKKKNPKSK